MDNFGDVRSQSALRRDGDALIGYLAVRVVKFIDSYFNLEDFTWIEFFSATAAAVS
jgi:hypothetical protein